jgi:hypothetical protein
MKADRIEIVAAPGWIGLAPARGQLWRSIRIGGSAGAISGFASYISYLQPFATIDPGRIVGAPFGPALCLGTAFACMFIHIRKSPALALLAVTLIYTAWYGAFEVAVLAAGNPYKVDPSFLRAGLAGGIVGSLGMIALTWILIPRARSVHYLWLCPLLGTVAGLGTCLMRFDNMTFGAGTALTFMIWQATILACLMAACTATVSPRKLIVRPTA